MSPVNRHVASSVTALALCLAAPWSASACSCFGPKSDEPCASYQGAAAVFVGTVTGLAEEKGDDSWPHQVVHFKVAEGFVGIRQDTLDVRTGMGSSDCGYSFAVGESYFVYAGSEKGELWTGGCRVVKPLAEAHSDLAYASQVARGGAPARLFGRVISSARGGLRDRLEQTGIAHLQVVAEGPAGQRLETETDAEGLFSFAGPLTGTYTVRAALPDRFPGIAPRQVTIPADDCRGVVLESSGLASLAGQVVDVTGRRGSDLEIELLPMDSGESVEGEMSRTSFTGSYSFPHLPPGSYILVVNPTEPSDVLGEAPYPKTFFPRGGSASQATRIVLRPSEERVLPDFVIPPRAATRTVTGVVHWPDGRPAAGVEVTLFYKSWGRDDKTDEEGRFKLNAYEGFTYELTARADITQDTIAQSEPQEVSIGGEGLSLDLVLTRKVTGVVRVPLSTPR
jgi:hypothetical protein